MSHERRPVIAGNWKMHKTVGEAKELVTALKARLGANPRPEVVVCPPFTALAAATEAARGSAIKVGAQTMNRHEKGAFTGEIAPGMLTDLEVTHVILGHSERRHLFGETDEEVNLKTEAAFKHGLVPIVCVGETLEEREGGLTDNVVIVQTQRALHGLSAQHVANVLIAYEPVWAIGTGKTCDADEADRVCRVIRDTVRRLTDEVTAEHVRILYGGSVKPDTIAEQMARPDIDGALVGGASLDVESFTAIVNFEVVSL